MSCGIGGRFGLDLALWGLWCRSAVAAPILTSSLGTSICCGTTLKIDKKIKIIPNRFNEIICTKYQPLDLAQVQRTKKWTDSLFLKKISLKYS